MMMIKHILLRILNVVLSTINLNGID